MRESAGLTIDKDEENWRRSPKTCARPLAGQPGAHAAHGALPVGVESARQPADRAAARLPAGRRRAAHLQGPEHQKLLDRFWHDPINKMKVKLPKKVRELSIYGEQCYPAFVNDMDGFVRLGYLDPDADRDACEGPGQPGAAIGIVTVKNKKGIAKRYRVIVNGPESVFTQRTQAIRNLHRWRRLLLRGERPFERHRGRSDLLAQIDWLDAYDEFLFGELDRWKFIRAFIWDVTLKGATEADVIKKAKNITAPAPARCACTTTPRSGTPRRRTSR
jgi:hypothetical protein